VSLFAIAEEGFLAALFQPIECGPGRMRLHEGLQPVEPCFAWKTPQRNPFQRRLDDPIFLPPPRGVPLREFTGLVKRDRLGKTGQVTVLLR